MKLLKGVMAFGLVFCSVFYFSACSSSSGTIRYGSAQNGDKSEEGTSLRYPQDNNSTESDTIVFNDQEDIPEFQDPGDLPEDETPLNLTEIIRKIEEKSGGTDADPSVTSKSELILMEIIKYMNTPYKFGGNSMDGIDCSAFTQNVYRNSDFYDLNRSAREQFKQGMEVTDRSDLKFGDLVFFNTRRRVRPGHVGIYIGDNLFAHASSKLGVTISSLDHQYYTKRYMGARRYDERDELGK